MTPEQQAARIGNLLDQFNGLDTGEVITVLATALQMAICYGARTKEDAMHMISCIMGDAEEDMPEQYDMVQAMREIMKSDGKGERLQ